MRKGDADGPRNRPVLRCSRLRATHLWTRRIDAAFRDRAPRMVRVDGADEIVVEQGQVLSGIGLLSNTGVRFESPERSPAERASRTSLGVAAPPTRICAASVSTGWPAQCSTL